MKKAEKDQILQSEMETNYYVSQVWISLAGEFGLYEETPVNECLYFGFCDGAWVTKPKNLYELICRKRYKVKAWLLDNGYEYVGVL